MTDDAQVPAPASSAIGRRWKLPVWWMVAVAPLVATLAAVVRIARVAHPMGSDIALFELRVSDVPAHLPLTGAFSRYGWNHPGPIGTYLVAPFYWLFSWRGLLIGAAVINIAALCVATLWMYRCWGARRTLVVQWFVLLAVLATRTSRLVVPWNPYLTSLPLLAVAASVLAVWSGRRWAELAAVVSATVVAQLHVTGALPAFALLIMVLAIVARRDGVGWFVRSTEGRVSLGVAVLLWLPPVIDQFFGEGNLGDVLRFASSANEPRISPRSAIKAWLHVLGPDGAWRTWGGFLLPKDAGTGWFVLPVLFALACWVAFRSRDKLLGRLLAVSGTLAASALVAILTIRGEAYGYLVQWVAIVGALLWAAVAMAAVVALRPVWSARWGSPAALRWSVVAGVVLVAALSIPLVREQTKEIAEDPEGVVPELAVAALAELDGHPARMCWSDPYIGTWAIGLGVTLEREGATIEMPLLGGFVVGDHRMVEHADARSLTVAAGARAIAAITEQAGPPLIHVDHRPPADIARDAELTASLQAMLRSNNAPDFAYAWVATLMHDPLATLPLLLPELADSAEFEELLTVRGEVPPVALFSGCYLWTVDG